MKTFLLQIATGIALLAAATLAGANDGNPFFRVEVIVFVHTDGRSDARITDTLESFGAVIDPLRRARTELGGEREGYDATAEELRAAMEMLETLATLEGGEILPEMRLWPEPFIALETLSGPMSEAHDRLQRSAGHQVVTWRAWHQPLDTGRNVSRVRLHDETPVSAEWIRVGPVGLPAASEPAPTNGDALLPVVHYRLDGAIRLFQRQFLHADIELQWREPAEAGLMPSTSDVSGRDKFEVHRLAQRRAIRPGRLEYFDSDWLGVLVLIEALEPLEGSGIDDDPDSGDGEH